MRKITSSTEASRGARSAGPGTSNGTWAADRLRLARTMRWATGGSGTRNARAISAVVSPPNSSKVSATRASVGSTGWQAVKMRRSRSSPMSSCCTCIRVSTTSGAYWASSASRSWPRASFSRVCSACWRRRSMARRLAVVISRASGLAGRPVVGQCCSAAASASCASSSARPTSRVMRATLAMMRAASIRHTESMVRCRASRSGRVEGYTRSKGVNESGAFIHTFSSQRLAGVHHVHKLPGVPIQVVKAARVHEAQVLRRAGGGAARSHGLVHQRIDFCTALAREAHQHLGGGACIGNRLAGKGLVEVLDQQHHEEVFAHHQAGALVVGELEVEVIAQCAEERLRAGHVLDGQVHEDLLVHEVLLRSKEGKAKRKVLQSATGDGAQAAGLLPPARRLTRPSSKSWPTMRSMLKTRCAILAR